MAILQRWITGSAISIAMCLFSTQANAGWTTTIISPAVGSYYPKGATFLIKGSLTYPWPCIFSTCIPDHIEVQLTDANDVLWLDSQTPPISPSYGSATWNYGNYTIPTTGVKAGIANVTAIQEDSSDNSLGDPDSNWIQIYNP
jgi:hypothetical protein